MDDDAFAGIIARAEARVGSTLNGKWRLERLLGVGGMACVYEATHRNRKRAAVKMLHPELSMNTSVRERFLREGYVANSVGHAGAVAVDDDDVTEDGCAFLVMEMLDGETLQARWERKGKRLPTDEVLSVVDQVLDTLTAAHEKGIVHRDLKPENLFLTRNGVVKVLDFGIARVRELSQNASKTQTGSMMGTPAFMPPEQALGHWDEVDVQSDLWAIGATMFTLLTGRYVHEAGTTNEALIYAATQRARSVAALSPELSFPIIELIDRALAYERSERWPSAATMQTALRRAYAGLQSAPDDQDGSHAPPRTGDWFEDETVAVSELQGAPGALSARRAVQVDSEIPPVLPPVLKPGAVTTARGVARGVFNYPFSGKQVGAFAVLGGLLIVAGTIGVWISMKRSSAEGSPTNVNVSATAGPEIESSTRPSSVPPVVLPVPTQADAPRAVSLDDLPLDSTARMAASPVTPSKIALDAQPAFLGALRHPLPSVPEGKPQPSASVAARPLAPGPEAKPEPPVERPNPYRAKPVDDPFSSRH